MLTLNKVVGFAQQQFSIDEVLELGQGKPAADNLVKTDAFASLQDYKIVANKIMIKGEVYIKILYSSCTCPFFAIKMLFFHFVLTKV